MFCPNPNNFAEPLGEGNCQNLDEMQVQLFPNFTSITFDYLLISWVTNYVSNLQFFDMFILDRIDRKRPSLERLELKFGLSSEFFNKISVRILLDVLCLVLRFFKASFYLLASSFMTF